MEGGGEGGGVGLGLGFGFLGFFEVLFEEEGAGF